MSFENSWSLASALHASNWTLDLSEGANVFEPLIVLFETWAARLASLNGIADVLRIAAAVAQLVGVLCDKDGCGNNGLENVAKLNELKQQTAATEAAAQRFRHAHGALAEAVTQTLEARGDTLPISLVQARDAAFDELRASLQLLEECGSRLNLDALQAATSSPLTPIESALVDLEQTTGINVAALVEDDTAPSDDSTDRMEVDVFAAMLRRSAVGMVHCVQQSAILARQLAEQFLAREGDMMLETASSLRKSICSIALLEGKGHNESLAAALRESTPWPAILRCASRHLAPLRAIAESTGSLQNRATALRSEVDAFMFGFTRREQAVLLLQTTHKAMKGARISYRRLKVEHEADSDDESDAAGVDPGELLRLRDAYHVATASRDTAARQLFLAAKAYHPETLLTQQRRLRLTGLSAIWSERTLDEYDEQCPFVGVEASRHTTIRGKHKGRPCILKLVPLQQGQTLCREAEILHHLNHPNVVKLEAAFVQDNFLYLHFPYAMHGDLARYLQSQTSSASSACIAPAQLRRMARQVCEAVAYLAERNIVHCDIKPANVFVDEERSSGGNLPRAILGDFDVSHTASGRTATLTRTLQTRSIATHYSAGYAAPEVVRAPPGQPPRANHKLDVYGLGCVIYHMHMYPRALPEPRWANDNVASRRGLFDHGGSTWPECAVPAWACTVPADLIASATHADPIVRLSARELLQTEYMRHADGEFARVAVQRPAHWQNQEHAGSWLVRESAEMEAAVEKLLNDTAKPETHGVGHNGHGVRFARFKVVGVHRVENSQVWSAYAARRRALADALAQEGHVLPEGAQHLSTSKFLYPLEGGTLEGAAGEVFLFHGTTYPESIASSGFDVRYAYAGAGAGAIFGRGVYFAESASKSDRYASRHLDGKLTLILARVCLGRCQVVRDGRGRLKAPFLPEVDTKSTAAVPVYYDSILTEVPGMHFREVVVGRDTLAYPELLVEYERV
jgi:serine/threonine protein kinase